MPRYAGIPIEQEQKKPRYDGIPLDQPEQVDTTELPAMTPADPDVPETLPGGELKIDQPTEREYSLGEHLEGISEAVLAMGTGATFGSLGYMAGAVKGVLSDLITGKDTAEVESARIAESLTNTPETDLGKKYLKEALEFIQPLEALGPAAPTQVLSQPIRPALMKVGESIARAVDNTSEAITKNKLKQKIQAGGKSASEVYEFKIEKGKVKKDRAVNQAIKQGIDKDVVKSIKGASKSDRATIREMAHIIKKGLGDADYKVQNRPSQAIGKTILKRWKTVKHLNKTAGKELEKSLKLIEGDTINIDEATHKFLSDLADIGVRLDGDFKPVFEMSDIEGVAGAENIINKAVGRMIRVRNDGTVKSAHNFKKFISEQLVSFEKESRGMQSSAERILKSLRHNINKAIGDHSDDYARANNKYSDTIKALDSYREAAGRKSFNPFSENADKFVGVNSRRLLSNVQSRVKLMDSIESLTNVSEKYGVRFNDNIYKQLVVLQELEGKFKPFAPKSFEGEIGSAIEKSAQAIAQQQGIKTGLIHGALKAGAKAARVVARKKKDDRAILKAINDLVKER